MCTILVTVYKYMVYNIAQYTVIYTVHCNAKKTFYCKQLYGVQHCTIKYNVHFPTLVKTLRCNVYLTI